MQPPRKYKGIQKLTGCLVALSRFISKSGERNLPFFGNLRRALNINFYWDDECNKAFEELKEYLGSAKLLSQPEPEETLHLYLAMSDGANVEVDHLSRLATTLYEELPQWVYVEICEVPAFEGMSAFLVLEELEDPP
ncbi:hypothetical protein LIER_22534 [Lithospermum erythrorhizon]|uniref:Uncharacterized protein n=1 Tax=Lithospermum erythrorhizon TaxID=34254 RepID=A0AAV3QWJ2_LITER